MNNRHAVRRLRRLYADSWRVFGMFLRCHYNIIRATIATTTPDGVRGEEANLLYEILCQQGRSNDINELASVGSHKVRSG